MPLILSPCHQLERNTTMLHDTYLTKTLTSSNIYMRRLVRRIPKRANRSNPQSTCLGMQTQQQARSSRQAGTHLLNVLVGPTLKQKVRRCTNIFLYTITVAILQRYSNPHNGTASLRAVAILHDGRCLMPVAVLQDCGLYQALGGPTTQKLCHTGVLPHKC